MQYLEARRRMLNADLLLFQGHGFWSRMIQRRTRSPFSHVGFAVRCLDRLMVLEARELRGVRLYPLSRYLAVGSRIWWYRMRPQKFDIRRQQVVEFAAQHLGKDYSPWWQFLRSWGAITPWVARRWGLPIDADPERFFCSELCMNALQHAGYSGEGPTDYHPARTAPGDLALLPCFQNEGLLEL